MKKGTILIVALSIAVLFLTGFSQNALAGPKVYTSSGFSFYSTVIYEWEVVTSVEVNAGKKAKCFYAIGNATQQPNGIEVYCDFALALDNPNSIWEWRWQNSNSTSAYDRQTVTISSAIQVPAGTHTIYFVARQETGTVGALVLNQYNLTAIGPAKGTCPAASAMEADQSIQD